MNQPVSNKRSPRGSRPARRRAFTLVELLVTIGIIGILTALIAGVAGRAVETGRSARTKQMVLRLHTLVMEHYDTFREKRVELATGDAFAANGSRNPNQIPDYIDGLNASGINTSSLRSGQQRAVGRLAAAREQMKMEMPDRWSDFLLNALNESTLPGLNQLGRPRYLAAVPTLAEVYRAQYAKILGRGGVTPAQLKANQGAECLYMVVMFATGQGESRGQFSETDFGDTDGDGAPEFLDGWGEPISFLRWAPGYRSEIQLSISDIESTAADASVDGVVAVRSVINTDRDPLDLFRVDRPLDSSGVFAASTPRPRGFRLIPLIYSGGPDNELGIRFDGDFSNFVSDPYVFDTDDGASGDNYLGESLGGGAGTDNITNHYLTGE